MGNSNTICIARLQEEYRTKYHDIDEQNSHELIKIRDVVNRNSEINGKSAYLFIRTICMLRDEEWFKINVELPIEWHWDNIKMRQNYLNVILHMTHLNPVTLSSDNKISWNRKNMNSLLHMKELRYHRTKLTVEGQKMTIELPFFIIDMSEVMYNMLHKVLD